MCLQRVFFANWLYGGSKNMFATDHRAEEMNIAHSTEQHNKTTPDSSQPLEVQAIWNSAMVMCRFRSNRTNERPRWVLMRWPTICTHIYWPIKWNSSGIAVIDTINGPNCIPRLDSQLCLPFPLDIVVCFMKDWVCVCACAHAVRIFKLHISKTKWNDGRKESVIVWSHAIDISSVCWNLIAFYYFINENMVNFIIWRARAKFRTHANAMLHCVVRTHRHFPVIYWNSFGHTTDRSNEPFDTLLYIFQIHCIFIAQK